MEQSLAISHQESLVNLSTFPPELLVYIISFLSACDKVKLRYVSRWLRCVIEGTPSLWGEFVWPYYGSYEECHVMEVLKKCGQHIKVLAFPSCEATLTLVEMLQYCKNVCHYAILLSPETTDSCILLIRMVTHQMKFLQTLEVYFDLNFDIDFKDIKELISVTSSLKELTIHSHRPQDKCLQFWMDAGLRPPNLNIVMHNYYVDKVINSIAQLRYSLNISTTTIANFKLYISPVEQPFSFSYELPYLQLHFGRSGRVTPPWTPCVKLIDFGISGSENDLALMTDYQYGGRTMYKVKCNNHTDVHLTILQNSIHITKVTDISCTTHFEANRFFRSDYLKQIAIFCPNLQSLNLSNCDQCLGSLQGIQAIASHCHNLQRLNLLGIRISRLEDHIQFWEILSHMNLIYLAVEYCVLTPLASASASHKKYQTIRELECCKGAHCPDCETLKLYYSDRIISLLPSLHCCKLDVISYGDIICLTNNCKELTCGSFYFPDPPLVSETIIIYTP